jgi:hypothetical protein
VKALREETREAEGELVAGAGGLADFDQAGRGAFWDAQSEARGPAHEHVRGFAIDEDGGRAVGVGAKMDAEEFDFAEGQGRVWADGVDAGLGKDFSGGLGASARHRGDLKPDSKQ